MCGLVLYDPIILYCGSCSMGWFQGTRQTQWQMDPYLQMGREGGGELKKNFFRASVWSKKEGEVRAPQALPLDPALNITVFELYFIVRNV